jgi:hypothetical protein
MKEKKSQTAMEETLNPLPVYPASEDIYNKGEQLENADPEDPSKNKVPATDENMDDPADLTEDQPGDELDVPGAELDDNDENIGNEDEENNYYSIGGDDHNDLDEDRGE